jgi:hypothetical protein
MLAGPFRVLYELTARYGTRPALGSGGLGCAAGAARFSLRLPGRIQAEIGSFSNDSDYERLINMRQQLSK